MGRIEILDAKTANEIKAGEVIERPVSVVKELFDNSTDAGASHIKVEFSGGGIELIRVTDDGCGMDEDDAKKAFLLHATSKLKTIDDIYDLSTQGFRGEALASVAACADVTLITKQEGEESGIKIVYEDGEFKSIAACAADTGTVVEVRNLFKNIPARFKFLKKDSTEGMYIATLIEKLAIINPHVAVKLVKDGKQILATPGSGETLDAIYSVLGRELSSNLIPIEGNLGMYKIRGFAGKPTYTKNNRRMQYLYVNDRPVKSAAVTAAIDEAYKNYTMKNKFPVCFLMIYCAPGSVDVNVHPQKAEVKFAADSDIFRLVMHAIRDGLDGTGTGGQEFFGKTEVPEETPEPQAPIEHKQLKINTGRYQRENPTVQPRGDPQAANRLLQILSEFKPNPEEIEAGEAVSVSVPDEITEVPAPPSEIDELVNAEFVGILFATYIILQSETAVFFVDQHAAHERVLYEKFMAKKESEDNTLQIETFLVPQIISVSSGDYSFITDNLDEFRENGFEIEPLEERQIALKTAPVSPRSDTPSKMFENIIVELKKDTPAKGAVWYSLIQTTACKAAIKAGDVITKAEALALIDSMATLKDPYHCAHGRPTFFKITRKDFEKNFKRIV